MRNGSALPATPGDKHMKRILPVIAAVMLVAACADSNSPGDLESVAAAFQTVPLGFENAQHSFAGSGDNQWKPEGRGPGGREGGGHRGPGGGDRGPGFGLFMGGGLHGLFMGDGFGIGFGHGRGEPSLIGVCTFDGASGRINCDPVTRNGLTVTKSAAYADAAGTAQSAFDETTTDRMNVRVTVTGTTTRPRDRATSTVDAASDRTVSGLAVASTERKVDGTSRATENIAGTDSTGAYTAVRVAGDTTVGIVIPKASTASDRTYPTAGSVTRSMQVTLTRAGAAPVVSSRREVITFDGSTTARVVITQDGTTKNCTLPLPRGRITC
jgi:hypothetical protein